MEVPTSPLDGAILKLPGKLDRLLRHGCALPKGVADEIPLIKDDLEKMITISSNLEDERAMMARCWRREVRELSYDVEDFVDQYEHAAAVSYTGPVRGRKITQRRKGKTTLPYWIREKLKQRLWMSNKIREFSTRAQEILQRHESYNLDAIAGSASIRSTDEYSTSWMSSIPQYGEEIAYVGVDAALKNLEELLKRDQVQQKLKVVSIVGFGGIGKTTLAMELYRKLGQQFDCRAFVRTSQKPDMRRIFISMLSQVRPHQPPDNWTVHSLISTIRTHLQHKRYFIIVEDLRATSTWDLIKLALPDSNCCSRILTTTEIEDLALQSCDHEPKHVYKMQPLGEDNSRKLFFSSVFGPQEECPPELMEISHDIIRKCGGLPLAIVSVASILSSQPGIQDRWDYVNKAIGYSLLTSPTWEGMKQVLDLSYNNLPQHLKACILYTGLYEEDTVIRKDDLVNQWIAEGFIQVTEGQNKKEIAKSFFDRLISRKLILPVDIKINGEVSSCTVHHMVLNLVIRSRSIEENFVTAIHRSQASTTLADKVRRLSLQFGNVEDAMPPTNMRLSHVRTLAFWGVFKCLPSVVQFRLLQVLILHFWGDKDSMNVDITRISELFRLRYLKVTSNVTLELRTQMRGLQSLETLTIDARISAVPSDIVQLPGLLHLNLPAGANLPSGIGHMTSLHTLGYFDLSSNSVENVESLSMLTNLRDLQLTCSTIQQEDLKSKMQCLLNSILERLNNLKFLTLVPRAFSHAKAIDDAGASGMSIFYDFSSLPSAPVLLQTLEVSPRICIFFCIPKWIGQLHNLCVLRFGISKIDKYSVAILRGLPALSFMSLYVHTKPAARVFIGKTGFPVIKYFKFKCCEPFLEFEEGAMPNLQVLKLAFNAYDADDQQSTIPVGMEYLSELKEVSAKIGGAGHEESQRSAAELAFRGAIRVHAKCQRVNVQCVKQIIGGNQHPVGDRYELVRDIGFGNFGIVRLMRNRADGQLVAFKYIERGEQIDENVQREIINHRSLRHPNIIRFKEVILTPTHLAIVMEYASGGDLFERICNAGRFNEDKARFFFQQLISGLSYCHSMQVCHRDLKLENILLDGPCLKICDFGYSKSSVLHSKPKSAVGTPAYVAPEVLVRKEYDGKVADVWSCGVTLYLMLVGACPFEDPDEPKDFRKAIKRILDVQYSIPDYVHISAECQNLISRIFVADPATRISIPEIRNHPWFLKNLPADLMDDSIMSNQYEEPEQPMQSMDEIMQILAEATIPAASSSGINQSLNDSPDLEDDMVYLDSDADVDSSGEIVYAM